MKVNKLFAVSLIVALVVAALPMSGVFAAGTGGGTGTNNTNGTISKNEIRNLDVEASIFNNLRTKPGQGITFVGKNRQYLARLEFALAQAEAIVAGRLNLSLGSANNSTSGTSSNGTSSSGTSSSGTTSSGTSSSGSTSGTATATPGAGTSSSGSTSGTGSSGTGTTSGTTSGTGTSSGTTTSNSVASSGSATGNNGFVIGKYYQRHPDKLLAMYLHMIRELRAKLGMGNACLAITRNGSNSGNTNGTSNGSNSNNGSNNTAMNSCQRSSTTSTGTTKP